MGFVDRSPAAARESPGILADRDHVADTEVPVPSRVVLLHPLQRRRGVVEVVKRRYRQLQPGLPIRGGDGNPTTCRNESPGRYPREKLWGAASLRYTDIFTGSLVPGPLGTLATLVEDHSHYYDPGSESLRSITLITTGQGVSLDVSGLAALPRGPGKVLDPELIRPPGW